MYDFFFLKFFLVCLRVSKEDLQVGKLMVIEINQIDDYRLSCAWMRNL